MEGYLLKTSSKVKNGKKSRVLIFTTKKGIRYGSLHVGSNGTKAMKNKIIKWNEINSCDIKQKDKSFVITTCKGKRISFECMNSAEWCKYINEHKTSNEIEISRRFSSSSSISSEDSEEDIDETENDNTTASNIRSSYISSNNKFFSNIFPVILTVCVVATSLVVEATYYKETGTSFLLQIAR